MQDKILSRISWRQRYCLQDNVLHIIVCCAYGLFDKAGLCVLHVNCTSVTKLPVAVTLINTMVVTVVKVA